MSKLDGETFELETGLPVAAPLVTQWPKVEYRVVSGDDEEQLSQKVSKLLGQGWELHGGVSCALSETDDMRYTLFSQAMVYRQYTGPVIRVHDR